MKCFIFLYPLQEIINLEINNHSYGQDEGEGAFRQKCKKYLNRIIDARYRKNGFAVHWAVFDDCAISDIIDVRPADKIIKVGLDFKTHTTKQTDGTFPYPSPDFILNQLGEAAVIRIAGFHMWDCVEKLAKRAYEREFDTLVDEDLTEFFFWRIKDRGFKIDEYPSFNPREIGEIMFGEFMKARRERPWLWQNY